MSLPDKRLPGIDALKGIACVMIIWHHLAFYGPMSDVVYPFAPALTDWLYEYGRMAVQVFLVVGGFLAAGSLAPEGVAASGQPVQLILRRYRRLLKPYLVALLVSVLVAALVRPWFNDPSVSAEPTVWQLLAHVLLLQDVLDQEALSAGVWYVAIDFQLFAMSVIIFGIPRQLQRRWPGPVRAARFRRHGAGAGSCRPVTVFLQPPGRSGHDGALFFWSLRPRHAGLLGIESRKAWSLAAGARSVRHFGPAA